jgi:hypothetical protein
LLLAKGATDFNDNDFNALVKKCDDIRVKGGSLDDFELEENKELADHLITAARLTPILYEQFRGNPRRIKRFLNDLNVRKAIAQRRGFTLRSDEVVKLMVLECILSDDFKTVLEWLASNQLRDMLEALDVAANGVQQKDGDETNEIDDESTMDEKERSKTIKLTEEDTTIHNESFSDTLRRWAKLPPKLDATSISSYLYLAASFAKVEVVDTGLPERLRDLAAALASNLKIDRAGISDQVLKALPEADAQQLVTYLGRRTRDQPTIQKFTIESLLRFANQQPVTQMNVVASLKNIPESDIEPATVIKFRQLDKTLYGDVLDTWKKTGREEVLKSIKIVEEEWEKTNGD